MKRAGLLLVLLCAAAHLWASDESIHSQVRQASESLTEAYIEGEGQHFRQNLAILEFKDITTDGSSRNISRAVEDLFSSTFSRSTVFTLVDRRNIKTLLEEQKLQLMGVTDSDDTVELGQIQNAQALLLGTVNLVDDTYLVNVRIVDVESGRMVAEDLSLDRREMIATKRRLDMEYISAMGVGISILGYDLTFGGNNPSLDFNDFNTTVFGRPFGVEYKYRPTTWFMLGLGIETFGGTIKSYDNVQLDSVYTDVPVGVDDWEGPDSGPFVLYAEGFGLLANAYFVWPATRSFSLFTSLGVEYLILDVEGYFHPDVETTLAEKKKTVGNGFGFDEFGPREWGVAPVFRLRAGFEWFLSPRAAFSLKAGYDIGSMEVNLVRQWHLDLPENVEVDLSGFTLAPSVSVYF
ncbi:MAG: FlgO family outer membrane protein [Spirochaetota bacterium]